MKVYLTATVSIMEAVPYLPIPMTVVCCGCLRAVGCCDETATRGFAVVGKRRPEVFAIALLGEG